MSRRNEIVKTRTTPKTPASPRHKAAHESHCPSCRLPQGQGTKHTIPQKSGTTDPFCVQGDSCGRQNNSRSTSYAIPAVPHPRTAPVVVSRSWVQYTRPVSKIPKIPTIHCSSRCLGSSENTGRRTALSFQNRIGNPPHEQGGSPCFAFAFSHCSVFTVSRGR